MGMVRNQKRSLWRSYSLCPAANQIRSFTHLQFSISQGIMFKDFKLISENHDHWWSFPIQPIHHEEKRQFDIMFARSSIGYVFKKTRGKTRVILIKRFNSIKYNSKNCRSLQKKFSIVYQILIAYAFLLYFR